MREFLDSILIDAIPIYSKTLEVYLSLFKVTLVKVELLWRLLLIIRSLARSPSSKLLRSTLYSPDHRVLRRTLRAVLLPPLSSSSHEAMKIDPLRTRSEQSL